jgi:hypothetical protein
VRAYMQTLPFKLCANCVRILDGAIRCSAAGLPCPLRSTCCLAEQLPPHPAALVVTLHPGRPASR